NNKLQNENNKVPNENSKLQNENIKFNLSVSKVAVSHYLNNLLYTLKTIRHEPENANNAVNKKKRRNFTLRRQGRSQRGERCTSIAAGSRSANIHCIGNVELIHYEIKRGSFRKKSSQEWIKIA
ncbi:hypothetical protein A3Q56_02794, partial [Intoshia linei]